MLPQFEKIASPAIADGVTGPPRSSFVGRTLLHGRMDQPETHSSPKADTADVTSTDHASDRATDAADATGAAPGTTTPGATPSERAQVRARAEAVLRELAGPAATLREDQWLAIEALVVDRRRALVVQRTGWGKSAVYFIATALLRGRGAGPR